MCDSYCSDITRTVAFGRPADPAAPAVYEIVSQAHWAARDAAEPGVTGEQVDAAARKVITDAGYGPQFVHRTGHGIGLSGHEPPYIVGGNTAPLQPGMCFSIEPGIYLPGRLGVRIENIVTMTPDGVRSLNAEAPRQLRVIGEPA
jgi:Xaa-Pro aminopeptidase